MQGLPEVWVKDFPPSALLVLVAFWGLGLFLMRGEADRRKMPAQPHARFWPSRRSAPRPVAGASGAERLADAPSRP